MPSISNASKARYLARVVAVLMRRMGVIEVRIPLKELENLPPLGFVAENDEFIVALGDPPT